MSVSRCTTFQDLGIPSICLSRHLVDWVQSKCVRVARPEFEIASWGCEAAKGLEPTSEVGSGDEVGQEVFDWIVSVV